MTSCLSVNTIIVARDVVKQNKWADETNLFAPSSDVNVDQRYCCDYNK